MNPFNNMIYLFGKPFNWRVAIFLLEIFIIYPWNDRFESSILNNGENLVPK